MALLFLEDDVLNDVNKWKESKEVFETAINTHIDTHYKSDESSVVYALFNPQQVRLMQEYYKGFSVEQYKELNGTVELQIKKRNEKVKKKIENLNEALGYDPKKFNLNDWVYDGMVDSGKNAGVKCDLCPHPIRYAHYAVNKKTKESLRFGCNCAADFFNMDETSIRNMKSLQAKTLRDIKYIATVIDLDLKNEYYQYLCGQTGKRILEKGIESIRDLMTYKIKWGKDGKVALDENGNCMILFCNGLKVLKPLDWVKDNITTCINADLDNNLYADLKDRLVEKVSVTKEEESELNTAYYINYAIKFDEVGLPIPLTICKKLNSIISKMTRTGHPDYIKFAQELLISHNLENSSLLQKVFTDFIVNYYASNMHIEPRDPELAYWGVGGPKTFYNTVIDWETAMLKLGHLKNFYSLVSQGYVTEEEFNKFLRNSKFGNTFYSSSSIKKYVNRCMKMFMTKKKVIKDEDLHTVTQKGISKYTIEGLDDVLYLGQSYTNNNGEKEVEKCKRGFSGEIFSPLTIPGTIGLQYYAMQESYKNMINESIIPLMRFLKYFTVCTTTKDSIRYLCTLQKDSSRENGSTHFSFDLRTYYGQKLTKEDILERMNRVSIDEKFYKEMYKKYKDMMGDFHKDTKELYEELVELEKNLKKPILVVPDGKKITASTINSDYEDLKNEEIKTNKDYFKDYCELLVSKRGNKRIQQYLFQKNLYALIVYKKLESYKEMLKDIQDSYIGSFKNIEIDRLYGYLNFGVLKDVLVKYLDTKKMEDFKKLLTYSVYKDMNFRDYNEDSSKFSRINANIAGVDKPMQEAMVMQGIEEVLHPEIMVEVNKNEEKFRNLYNSMKELFTVLKKSKERITFEEVYAMLGDKSPDVEEYLNGKDLVTCETFNSKVMTMLYGTSKYGYNPKVSFENDNYYGSTKLVSYLKIFGNNYEDLKAIEESIRVGYQEYEKAKRAKEREERIKGPYLDELRRNLNEHIKYQESAINDLSERRKDCYHNVKFQSALEEGERFIEELKLLNTSKLTKGAEEAISVFEKDDKRNAKRLRCFVEALRAEMYNQKLIYNYFDVTNKVFKNLRDSKLEDLTVVEIQEIGEMLKYYYILKSQVDKIVEILTANNMLTIDYKAEVSNIPNPKYTDVEKIIEQALDKADSTGFTGVEKANMVRNHSDFNKLPDFLQNICNSVIKYSNCSPKQLRHVNKAFEDLGLGKPDKIEELEETVDNPDNTGLTGVEKAKMVKNHNDFNNLPDYLQSICNSVVNYSNCSPKQLKHVNKAFEQLGLGKIKNT